MKVSRRWAGVSKDYATSAAWESPFCAGDPEQADFYGLKCRH
jgi:hypothetical protein